MTKYRDEKLLKAFGENLKKIRLSKGFSQEKLAHRANLGVTQIARIERGEVNTTISTAYLISQVLEIPFSSLFNF